MKAISEFVVHVSDLLEAEGAAFLTVARGEGRRVRSVASTIALGVGFLLAGVPLIVAGLLMGAVGLMWWLETQVSRPAAAALTGLAILAVATLCLFAFRSLTGRREA